LRHSCAYSYSSSNAVSNLNKQQNNNNRPDRQTHSINYIHLAQFNKNCSTLDANKVIDQISYRRRKGGRQKCFLPDGSEAKDGLTGVTQFSAQRTCRPVKREEPTNFFFLQKKKDKKQKTAGPPSLSLHTQSLAR
jgi:hypothetical protein